MTGRLGRGTPGDPAWQEFAACEDTPAAGFFPEPGETTLDDDALTAAKAHCAVCPVTSDCLDYAIRNRVTIGVWGGLDANERASLIRQRRKAARQGEPAA